MRHSILLTFLAFLLAAPASAQTPSLSDEDRQAIREVIGAQVEAFRRDDGQAAFGYATPAIQQMFGTAETFMDMVRQGYQPVYRPRLFEFEDVVELNGQPAQLVRVVGPDGRHVKALYPMRRMPDGRWRIDGCYLEAPAAHQA